AGRSGERGAGLAMVCRGGRPVSVPAEGGVEVPEEPSWEDVAAAGIATSVVEPLRRWTVSFASDQASFDFEAEALGAIAELDERSPVAKAGGMAGYEQPCRLRGNAVVGGPRLAGDPRGQRGPAWRGPAWERG